MFYPLIRLNSPMCSPPFVLRVSLSGATLETQFRMLRSPPQRPARLRTVVVRCGKSSARSSDSEAPRAFVGSIGEERLKYWDEREGSS